MVRHCRLTHAQPTNVLTSSCAMILTMASDGRATLKKSETSRPSSAFISAISSPTRSSPKPAAALGRFASIKGPAMLAGLKENPSGTRAPPCEPRRACNYLTSKRRSTSSVYVHIARQYILNLV
jgi:hypothetical protein